MLDLEFMRLAFGAGIVVGLLAPAVGFFLVQRRLSLVGDGIGHVAFAGVALGYLLNLPLVLTALVVSVTGGLSIEWIRSRRRTAGDQALALIFYTGIAGGVVLVSAAGALNVNLFQFLFGWPQSRCSTGRSSQSWWTRKARVLRGSRSLR